jgi:hypothetical protein
VSTTVVYRPTVEEFHFALVSVDVSVGAADGFFDFVAAPQRTSDAV